MKKSVAHYISELLFLHDCVIIPSFGGLVGNIQSAKLNKNAGILYPPSKQILFNKNLRTNDGLLISYIAEQEQISQSDAKNKLTKFAEEITNKLLKNKTLRLDNIGLFTINKEGNTLFIQDHSVNYNLDAFGMDTAYKKELIRIDVQEHIERTVHQITAKRETTPNKTLWRAAAVIIPLVALSYLSVSQQERINNVYTQMATLNPFTTTEIIEVEKIIEETIPIITAETNIEITPIVEVIEEEVAPIIIPQKKYYIIGGAFAKKKNADNLMTKLRNWHYNPTIVEGGNLLRVSYKSFNNKETAILALNIIRKENKDAWLLTK